MAEIGESGPTRPPENRLYEAEYKQGADLFQRALKEHAESSDPYQREEFREVMDKAMQILNETARELKERDLLDKNAQIEKDYKAYQNSPTSDMQKQLEQDLQEAKNAV